VIWPARAAKPAWGINHVLAYGQSLSSGWEGFPALSTAPRHDSLMLGDSVRPRSESAPAWVPVGEAAFRPLRATVQDLDSGAVLAPEQVARAQADTLLLGETVLEGAINFFRARAVEADGGGSGALLASSCGVGGRSLESLSLGASPNLFNRLSDCVRLARALAEAGERTYGIAAILFLQGEHNAWGLDGATTDGAAYRSLLERLYADMIADLAAGIAGQAVPPALFLYQTGGAYASESNAIPQAQLDMSLAVPTCFLAAPAYPVTDKGGHLDANGYRWLGAQFGKVMFRALAQDESWRPLHPVSAWRDGDAVEIAFHVPHPPLAWDFPFRGHERVTVADRGFSLRDAVGLVPIADVALTGAARVRIRTRRPFSADAVLRYADAAHFGVGALRDSDPAISDDQYQYAPGTGHWPSANIPELVGRPYPLHNWCVAFAMRVT
jgi:hypothetical protein